jgi:hypothetical protein
MKLLQPLLSDTTPRAAKQFQTKQGLRGGFDVKLAKLRCAYGMGKGLGVSEKDAISANDRSDKQRLAGSLLPD